MKEMLLTGHVRTCLRLMLSEELSNDAPSFLDKEDFLCLSSLQSTAD